MSLKKIILIICLIFLLIVLFFALLSLFGYWAFKKWASPILQSLTPTSSLSLVINATTVKVFDKELTLLLAQTPSEHEKGLSQIKSLEDFDGMLFLFNKKSDQTFWNKDTFLDLIIYWMDGEKVLKMDYLPSIEKTKTIKRISAGLPVDRVIEYVIKPEDDFFLLSPLPKEKISSVFHLKGLARPQTVGNELSFKLYDENNFLLSQKKIQLERKAKNEDFVFFDQEITLNLVSSTPWATLEFYNQWQEKIFSIPLKLQEIEKPIYQAFLNLCTLSEKSI